MGLAPAIQRLESLFPAWGPCLSDDTSKLRQKDLLKEAVAAAHSDFLRQLGERDRSRVESYSGAWADGWTQAIPSQAFDTHLPNVAFHDILSMRLGLSIFDADEECRMCPQSSDAFGHHCLSCNMMGKTTLHNLIRDEVFRALWGGGLGVRREPIHLLPEDPARRPADILTVPTPEGRQSAWKHFGRIAMDFVAVVSPFRQRIDLQKATEQHAQHKRQDRATLSRCNEQGIGFESIVFDYAGGLNVEGTQLMDSLCRAVDGPLERPLGTTKLRLRERISFALQRHLHRYIQRRREGEPKLPLGGANISFLISTFD